VHIDRFADRRECVIGKGTALSSPADHGRGRKGNPL